MADGYKVGNLEIAFKVVDQTSASFKDLAKNLKAINSLITKLSNADLSPFVSNIKAVQKALSPMLTKISGASEGIIALNQSIQKVGITGISKAADEFNKVANATDNAASGSERFSETVNQGARSLQNQNIQTKEVTKSIEELVVEEYKAQQAALALGKAGTNTRKYKTELADLINQQNKATKSSNKLLKSIGRIAVYRTIRRALQIITQSLTETIKAFATVDDSVNNTMSQLTSSLSVIRLSFGTAVLPFLEMITPIVMEIGIAFADLANMVSQAMSTTGTYTKINTDLIKNYRDELSKTGSLLDFDKFRVLNKQNGGLIDFLIPNQKVDKTNEKIKNLRETLNTVKSVLLGLWEIIKPIGNFLIEHLDIVFAIIGAIMAVKIGSNIGDLITSIKSLGSVLSIIASHPIVLVITAIAALLIHLYTTNEQFRESVQNLIKTLSPLMSLLSEFLSAFLQMRLEALEPLINDVIAPLATYLIRAINMQLSATMLQLTPLMFALEFILKVLQTIFTVIQAIFSANWSKLSSLNDLWENWSSVGFAKSSWSGYTGSVKDVIYGTNSSSSTIIADKAIFSKAEGLGATAMPTTTIGNNTTLSANTLKSAFYQALMEYGNRNDNINVIVELDGTQIYRGVTNRANQSGEDWRK